MVSSTATATMSYPATTSSNSLWKGSQQLASELTLNALVYDASGSYSPASWPSSSSSASSSCFSASVITLQVPQDYATLPAAIEFANQEFQKHDHNNHCAESCTTGTGSTKTKTIRILIDPHRMPVCSIEEPLLVQAHKHGHLILDVASNSNQPVLKGDPAEDPSHKRARTSPLSSAEAPLKGVISMETREPNQPLLLHSSGSLTIRNLRLEHYSPVDMFVLAKTRSRNAALVVEHADDSTTPLSPLATIAAEQEQTTPEQPDHVLRVNLEHVALTSYAGRGIINRCHHPSCQINQHDCFVAKLWA